MKKNKDIHELHLVFYSHIRKVANGRIFIGHHDLMEILKRYLHNVSRALYYPIIKRMEKDKLIKKLDRTKYEITGGSADHALRKYFPV